MSSQGVPLLKGPALPARQEATLRALIDAFLPPLTAPQEHHDHTNDASTSSSSSSSLSSSSSSSSSLALRSQKAAETRFWNHRLSADPVFLRYIENRLSVQQRRSLRLLSTAVGTAWATGRWWDGVVTGHHALADWPVPRLGPLVRHAMTMSPFVPSRVAMWHSWKRFICGSAFMYVRQEHGSARHDNDDDDDASDSECYENPYAWEALEYPGPYVLNRARDAQVVTQGLEGIKALLRNVSDKLTDADGDKCDVIVVGSGAGGAMVARVLSEAGLDVIVMEEAPNPLHHRPNRLLEEDCSYACPVTRGRADILIWTGGIPPSLGGATRYGLGIVQSLPNKVRQEWVNVYGLEDFGLGNKSEFDESLTFVLQEIREFAALDDETQSPYPAKCSLLNSCLRNGCDKLGYKYDNTELCTKGLGLAGMAYLGDRYLGTKRTSLNDLALAPKVRTITSVRVETVRTAKVPGSIFPRATGVKYVSRQTGERKFLSARKCVVVAAGALESPCLLRRSGFRNPHIGQHLRLHPSSTLFGFAQEGDSSCFVGAPSSVVCTEFDQDLKGYGTTLHTIAPHPGLMAMLLPWDNPQKFKERMLRVKCMVPILCIQRDTSEGSVREGRDGTLNIDYKLNEKDSQSMIKTIQAALCLEAAAGATELISGCIRDSGRLLSGNDTTPLLDDYLRSVKEFGMREYEHNLVSLHQMGTCRISKSPRSGVVDPNGEVWECHDLYVMDSSIFPTAIGVHPMITVMALARMLSLRLATSMKCSESKDGSSPAMPKKASFLGKRRLYAVELRIKLFVKAVVRLIMASLTLIPAFLFWWYGLSSPLA